MSFQIVQKGLTDALSWCNNIADVVNRIMDGKTNNTGDVTLTASSATSTVTDHRVGVDSVILFMPTTASAATEFAAGTMYVSSRSIPNRTFTITHVNSATADRTFRYVVIG